MNQAEIEIPAAQRAFLWLQDKVVDTPWNQDAFFSENSIAKESGVSRTPVREAVLRLEARELIRRIPFKGAYVPALTQHKIDEHLEVRKVIGAWASEKVAELGTVDTDRLRALITQQHEQLDEPYAFIETDHQFHVEIVHAANNAAFSAAYESQRTIQKRLGLKAILSNRSRRLEATEEHEEMLQAFIDRNAPRARDAAVGHLAQTAKAMKTHLT